MNVLEMAKKYYPVLCNIGRIKTLVAAGKLTPEEYKEVTGEDYSE